MPTNSFLKNIISFLNLNGQKKEKSYIPESLKKDVLDDIGSDDSLLICIESLSSTYRPKNWFDRNTFFNTYLIVTKKRVIVAKNSSELKIFRDIDLDQIRKHKFSRAKRGHNIIELDCFDSKDKIVIHKTLSEEVNELKKIFEHQLNEIESNLEKDFIFCIHCGFKIPTASKFCSSCGKKVKV